MQSSFLHPFIAPFTHNTETETERVKSLDSDFNYAALFSSRLMNVAVIIQMKPETALIRKFFICHLKQLQIKKERKNRTEKKSQQIFSSSFFYFPQNKGKLSLYKEFLFRF